MIIYDVKNEGDFATGCPGWVTGPETLWEARALEQGSHPGCSWCIAQFNDSLCVYSVYGVLGTGVVWGRDTDGSSQLSVMVALAF